MSVTRRRLVLFVLATLAAALVGGCGQKGPLYLPDESEEDKDEKKKNTAAPARVDSLPA